jgi:hypothetical protein
MLHSHTSLVRVGTVAALAAAPLALLLGACSRTSSPATDATVAPVQSAPAPSPTSVQSVAPSTAPVQSAAPAASTAPVQSVAPVTSSGPPASSGKPAGSAAKAEDCSRIEQAPEYRNLPAEDRARARLTCETKEEFRAFVAGRQSCAAASDCAIVSGSCPFGCYVPVRKGAASEVTAKLEELGGRLDKAGHRCVYRCMGPPAPACVDQRCASGRAD